MTSTTREPGTTATRVAKRRAILDLLRAAAPHGKPVDEIVAGVDCAEITARRILAGLRDEGLVDRISRPRPVNADGTRQPGRRMHEYRAVVSPERQATSPDRS